MTVTRSSASRQQAVAPTIALHPGHQRLFAADKLTIGLILPLETHPDTPAPSMRNHIAMAQKADEYGIGALWMRDVPFYDPSYGDVGQVFEPLIYIATLAAATRSIALGTAGIVLPIREHFARPSFSRTNGARPVVGRPPGRVSPVRH